MTKTANPEQFRAQFPACQNDDIYLDSAATALKPWILSEVTAEYYQNGTATAFRSTSLKANKVTEQIEKTRQKIAQLLGHVAPEQIIWTGGATASINLVAYGFGLAFFNADSEIIISELEHHSNIIPWLQIAKLTGAKIKIWQAEENGCLEIEGFKSLLSPKTAFVALTQMSNVTGFTPDLHAVIELAHSVQAKVLIDGAQGCLAHFLNVKQLDVDFYVFSAHKYYGPTGLGILYGKRALLESMAIWQGGGKMIETVDFNSFSPALLPYKFEAGTPNIAAILGFGAVLNWLDGFDHRALMAHVKQLTHFACTEIEARFSDELEIISDPNHHLVTFATKKVHCDDLAMILAQENIAIRSGKLCAHPLLNRLKYNQVIRASILPYNTQNEIERFLKGIELALTFLK